jgi:predicted kinase
VTTPTPAGTGGPLSVAPLELPLPGRTLLLVAGMPGAGKSTLLAELPRARGVRVVDSDAQRSALRRVLPAVPYDRYRPLVHVLHRTALVLAALSPAPTVVAHLPATDPATRAAVSRLAAVGRRTAHLVWLDVDPCVARRGQRERGRLVPEPSFARHAERATGTAALLSAGPQQGWRSVTVLDRAAARAGLRLRTGREAHGLGEHK